MKALVVNKDHVFYGRIVDVDNLQVSDDFTEIQYQIKGVLTNNYTFNRNTILSDKTISAKDIEPIKGEGISMIAKERNRQIEQKGYDSTHDFEHEPYNFVYAAQAYLTRDEDLWPWESKYFKPSTDMIRNLEKAGALIAAAIDRILLDEETKE